MPSPSIGLSKIALITQKNFSTSYSKPEELFRSFKVGYVRSYDYPKAIDELLKRNPKSTVAVGTEESLLRMLSAGRLDLVLSELKVGNFYLNSGVVKNLKVFKNLVEAPLLIALKKTPGYEKKLHVLQKRVTSSKASKICDDLEMKI